MTANQALMNNELLRVSISQSEPTVLSRIYEDEVNMAVWTRDLDERLKEAANSIIETQPNLRASLVVNPENIRRNLQEMFDESELMQSFIDDVEELVQMFCCLFDLKNAGLRITVLNKAMCPRFHIDRVPCRLITTYQGHATQWLANDCVDRSMLNVNSKINANKQDIQQLNQGDVALLKGDIWEGNEGAALVHRSPSLINGERRLLLTLDCMND